MLRIISFSLVVLCTLIVTVGCSRNFNNSVSTSIPGEGTGSQSSSVFPVVTFDCGSAIGLAGVYNLSISSDYSSVELIPIRNSSLGESYIVSGFAYFTVSPCVNCLKLESLLPEGDFLKVTFSLDHPFEKGNPSQPPTAVNRFDLDVFDTAMVIVPTEAEVLTYPLTGISVYDAICGNTDGLTTELENVTGDPNACPYFLVIDDNEKGSKTNNRLEMGMKDAEFDTWFTSGRFDLFLAMGYGASAKKPQRLNPTYYIPEFNRKAPWKIVVTPPQGDNPPRRNTTWCDDDPITEHTVTIDIYDWNHGATVADEYPDPENIDHISAPSDIIAVTVEIEGMTNSIVTATTTDTVTDGWSDPITYTASFANENEIPGGEYSGLVKVTDSRVPGSSITGGETDTLVHTPDGGFLEWHDIIEFSTYQTFTATVLVGNPYAWARTWGGDHPDRGRGLTTDTAGNIYVTGQFEGTVDFNPGSGVDQRTANGNGDIFITKFDSDGNFVWARTWGSGGFDVGYELAFDGFEYIYATGEFKGTLVDFNPGSGVDGHATNGGDDIYLCKYSTDGRFVWACTWGSTLDDSGRSVACDSMGDIYVSGFFRSSNVDFDPGDGEDYHSSNGQRDAFLCKFDADGNYIWAQTWGEADHDSSTCVATDSNINALVTMESDTDTIRKYDSNGNLVWESTTSFEKIHSVAIDNADNIYAAGENGLSKFASNGSSIWDFTWVAQSFGVAVDSTGKICVTGIFSDSAVDFDPGPDEDWHTTIGEDDIFLSTFNTDGEFIWATTWGGSDSDYAFALTIDNSNAVFITGTFDSDAVDFDPGSQEDWHYSVGLGDTHLSKFYP